MIVDDRGEVVWFHPLENASATTFRVQRYRGKAVLTRWEGQISNAGVGKGVGVVYDSSYRQVARVRAGNGYQADLHEFLLTPHGTALISAYNEVTADLSSVGGPTAGTVLDSIVQGRRRHRTRALRVAQPRSRRTRGVDPTDRGAVDSFDVNSIEVDADGNLLFSARNTCASTPSTEGSSSTRTSPARRAERPRAPVPVGRPAEREAGANGRALTDLDDRLRQLERAHGDGVRRLGAGDSRGALRPVRTVAANSFEAAVKIPAAPPSSPRRHSTAAGRGSAGSGSVAVRRKAR
jgi:Arylsulfotransferase (ASST)